jgi:hypothetical protein
VYSRYFCITGKEQKDEIGLKKYIPHLEKVYQDGKQRKLYKTYTDNLINYQNKKHYIDPVLF